MSDGKIFYHRVFWIESRPGQGGGQDLWSLNAVVTADHDLLSLDEAMAKIRALPDRTAASPALCITSIVLVNRGPE